MPPVRPCLHLAAAETDILWIVKNYAGDIMNVEMAAEMFDGERATVPTNDDVAVEDSLHSQGRHGVAGTDVGAAAEHATISNAAERSRRGSMRHPAPWASLSRVVRFQQQASPCSRSRKAPRRRLSTS